MYEQPVPITQLPEGGFVQQNTISIGEALEASAQIAGDRPVDESDAAAIHIPSEAAS